MLAKIQGASVLHFSKCGIKTPKDPFSRVTLSLKSCEDMQVQFHLARLAHQTFYLLVSTLPSNFLLKLGIETVKPWWKD